MGASIYAAERAIALEANFHEYGQAPASWTALVDHLRAAGHSDAHIEAAGRLNPARDEDRYNPKCLNTPETVLYHKGSVQIGLGENRGALARGAHPVIVEGPFGAAVIDEAGRGQYLAVALGGTALTADQARALTAACPEHTPIRIAFDADRGRPD